MKPIFDQIQYENLTYYFSSNTIKLFLELNHEILEENENYIHYVIKKEDTDVYFSDFNIVYIKNTDFNFREQNRNLYISLARISDGLFNEYYIKINSYPEHVIKKLVKEKPSIGLPLLYAYSHELTKYLFIEESDLSKFTESLCLLNDYLTLNNITHNKHHIDIKKIETLNELELTQYIDNLKIPKANKFKQYCDLDFLPILINNDYCIVDYSSRSFYRIVKNENNFKIYFINLDYPTFNLSDDNLYDIVSEFLHHTGQNLHLLIENIGEEHLIFESVDNKIKLLTNSISNFETVHSFLFKKIKNKIKKT